MLSLGKQVGLVRRLVAVALNAFAHPQRSHCHSAAHMVLPCLSGANSLPEPQQSI